MGIGGFDAAHVETIDAAVFLRGLNADNGLVANLELEQVLGIDHNTAFRLETWLSSTETPSGKVHHEAPTTVRGGEVKGIRGGVPEPSPRAGCVLAVAHDDRPRSM